MQSILLKNFKSYEQQSINDLNSRINVILGSNGQGKSNFFKAISFLFTDKYTINRAEFNGTLNRGARTDNPEILVQVNFSQKQQSKPYQISKYWRNYTEEDLKINDKSKSRAQYENFIQSFGLSYTSPYNIVQQGKVTQISQMTENQLYLLLEDTAGVKRFMKKHEQAQNNLQKIQKDLKEVEQCLGFLKDKVSQVQDKKNEYEFYSVQQKVRKIKKKRQLQNYLKGIQKTITKMKQKYSQVLKDLQSTKLKQKEILFEIEERERKLKVITEQSVFYEKQDSQVVQESISMRNRKTKNPKKAFDELKTKIDNQGQKLKLSNDRLTALQKELNTYRQKYETIKVDFQAQGESKDAKKIKQAYQAKIQSQKQNIKIMEDQLKKVIKIHSQFKLVNYSQETIQLAKLQEKLNPTVQKMRKLRIQQIELARKKMNNQCELQTVLGRKKHLDDLMRKIMPNLDFRLLKYLDQNKVQGVYGYLIQFLKIDPNVAFAYQLVGLSKLCTLLVKDDKVAAQVVQVNKKIHGKNINILPLSFVNTQPMQKRSYPKIDNVFSLTNQSWISQTAPQRLKQIKKPIQKIINNTFSKYLLVEDYSTALKVSKQYSMNCITGDRQIVYADAYMCKVGRQQVYQKGKIQIYQMHQNLSQKVDNIRNQLNEIQKHQVRLQNDEINLINQKEKYDLQINQLQKVIDQAKKIQTVIQKLQFKNKALQQSLQRSNRTIQQYETALKNMQNNVKTKFKIQDLKKAQSQYFQHKQKVQKMYTQNYEKQKSISTMLKDLQILGKQVNNQQKNDLPLGIKSKQQIIKQLNDQKTKIQTQITNFNKDLAKIIENKVNLKQKQAGLMAELNGQEENQKDIANKFQALADINPQDQDQIQQLSNSLSRKLSNASVNPQKKHFYTARDKVFFNKISQYTQKLKTFIQSTDGIRKQKQKLLQYIKQTQNQAKQHMKSFITNFEKNFISYFLKIVPNGKAQMKTKIYSQKIKGITKSAYSLEIKVSFNEEQAIRKWSEFSGGQKTVLALCIILSIQKCQPTPFCVLDQVDAALDPFYANKIVDIIIEESKFCQYFITSFKKSMIDLPEDITNYYLVNSVNRVSNIKKIEKSQAQDFISQIAQ